jgi:hypothetical protein
MLQSVSTNLKYPSETDISNPPSPCLELTDSHDWNLIEDTFPPQSLNSAADLALVIAAVDKLELHLFARVELNAGQEFEVGRGEVGAGSGQAAAFFACEAEVL